MKYQPFPIDLFPEPLARYVRQGAAAIGCDAAYIAVPLLPALAAAIGNTRRIRLKNSWPEPAVVWCAAVGDSSSMKSPAADLAMKAVRRRQKKLMKEYHARLAEYAAARREWKAAPRDERGEQPEPPPPPEHLVCSDVTVEALADRLESSPRGVLVDVDELAMWFRGLNQYKGGGGSDVPQYLFMFNGRSLKVDRKSVERPTIFVPYASVSIFGTIQPDTLRSLLTQDMFDCGLAARFLMVRPPRRPKKWTEVDLEDQVVNDFQKVFDALFDLQPERDLDGEPCPVALALTDEARAAWIEFYNEFAEEQAQLEGALAAAAGKLEGYAARLSLIIHCARQAAGETVDAWLVDDVSVRRGIEMARWFMYETRRAYGLFHESKADVERRKLENWIRMRGGRVTIRDVTRGPRVYRDNHDGAEDALRDLVEREYGRWEMAPPKTPGAQVVEYFVLNDCDGGEVTSKSSPNNNSGVAGARKVQEKVGRIVV